MAASAESRSEHPLAKAIVAYSQSAGTPLAEPAEFSAAPGHGVRAKIDGHDVRVGRISQPQHSETMPSAIRSAQDRLEDDGKTVVAVLRDDGWLGLIALADECRAEAASDL